MLIRGSMKKVLWLPAMAFSVYVGAFGCEDFDAPPIVQIAGLEDGLLESAQNPVQLVFSEPVDKDSLKVKIARLELDDEGNLPDETNAGLLLDVLYDSETGVGGTGFFEDEDTRFTIKTQGSLPVGPRLVVLIEPGLQDIEGNKWEVRQRLEFGYEFDCGGDAVSVNFQDGVYFFIADVVTPIETQLQLLADLRIDPSTGIIYTQFTSADRITDPNRCDPPCGSTEVCRTIPVEECVPPSEQAGSVDEHPDFYPNPENANAGYTFGAPACVDDQGETGHGFGNNPVDAVVPSPPVTVVGLVLSGAFEPDASGVMRGSGSFTSDDVLLGAVPSGAGSGSWTAVRIADEQVPDGVPGPELPADFGMGTPGGDDEEM